jgi:hypothetical protein
MVAVVLAFPRIVTGNVSKAAGAISGSGADEIRRQLENPDSSSPPPSGSGGASNSGEGKDDAKSEIEKMLKQQ